MNLRTSAVTILAALLAVLTLASSAWAECAWVLWVTPPDLSWYHPMGGYETRESCDMRAKELNKASYEKQQEQKPAGGHLCLPGTVDPRGPKASGR